MSEYQKSEEVLTDGEELLRIRAENEELKKQNFFLRGQMDTAIMVIHDYQKTIIDLNKRMAKNKQQFPFFFPK